MFESLYIRDFALIDEIEIDFSGGFNVITGETGAGKSILIGAIKLLLGERAESGLIRSGARKAIVEGKFDVSDVIAVRHLLDEGDFDNDDVLVLRRELSDSKSRAFINDTPATVQQLRQLGEELVDLHGQHEHQSLLRTEKHGQLVDAFGGLEKLTAQYVRQYKNVSDLYAIRDDLRRKEEELEQQRELLEFQISEIDALTPTAGEEEALDTERRILENSERLYTATASLFDELYETENSVHDLLVRVRNEIQDLARIDESFEAVQQEVSSAQVSISEVAKTLQDYNAQVEFNPARLEEIRERLIALDKLKLRYGGTLEAVLVHRTEIGEKYAIAVDFQGTLGRVDDEITAAQEVLSELAIRQSAKRKEVAARIEASILVELAELGMPNARFEIQFECEEDEKGWITIPSSKMKCTARATGMEAIQFLISTNEGEQVKPLGKVASGGEISRIMLAMKAILAKNDRLPVLVFDEIDSGISGRMAQKVGEKLSALGSYHQILAITHLAQVASLAGSHFKVSKISVDSRTTSSIIRLDEESRTEEIAGLISGSQITETARENARALLESRSA